MRPLCSLSYLPTSLLTFVWFGTSNCAMEDLPWPYNLPPNVKYYPEDEMLVKRNIGILQKLQQQQPLSVKKMSHDPSEMFFMDYWSFPQLDYHNVDAQNNMSVPSKFELPLPLHAGSLAHAPRISERYLRLPIPAANLFARRDFTCPTGTNACASINRPNACCPTSSTCQIVRDTGLGDVGCCDAAQTCAGSLSQCPTSYTSCPKNPGGGCCLPGYACFQEGCVQTSTTVVIVTPTPSTTSSSPPPPSPPTVTDTTTVVVTTSQPSPTTLTMTETVNSNPTTLSPSSTPSANTLICSSGFRSCPASLGGGCCPTDRACARDACPALTSTASLDPPVRGTSSSPSTTDTGIVAGCPTGFYACSAYNPGGCCQVDRDCHSTSCPARSDVTVVNTGSVTIAAPTGTSVGLLTGICATGWSTCDPNVGGGCCPSGYACGTMACTASVSGLSATQGKIAPNGAERTCGGLAVGMTWGLGVLAVWMLILI